MARSDNRLFSWFRSIPMMVMAALLAVSFLFSLAPTSCARLIIAPLGYTDAIIDSSTRHGVDPYLVCAIIKCESGWDAEITSAAGAEGLMQVMPDTAQSLIHLGYVDSSKYDPANLHDPVTNIEYGCACLNFLADHLSTTDEIIAGYNAGVGSVQGWTAGGYENLDDVVAFPETAAYLVRVRAALEEYKNFYPNGIDQAS